MDIQGKNALVLGGYGLVGMEFFPGDPDFAPVSYFLEGSLANHHVIVPGNHAKMLSEFFAFALRE